MKNDTQKFNTNTGGFLFQGLPTRMRKDMDYILKNKEAWEEAFEHR